MKIIAKIEYPIIIQRKFTKEFNIDILSRSIERRKQFYGDSFTKEDLKDLISDFSYDLYEHLGEEIISKNDDINLVDEMNIEGIILNIEELVEYYSYLIPKQ